MIINQFLMKNPRYPVFACVLLSIYSWLGTSLSAMPIKVLAWDDGIAAMPLALVDSKGSTPIVGMHPAKRTKSYQAVVGEALLAIEVLDKKDSDGKPCKVTFTMPQGVRQPLLIVLPDAKSASGIRPIAIEDDVSTFSWGSTHFINATSRPLVFVGEKKAVDLPPSWSPVQFSPGGETRNIAVQLFLRDQPTKAIYSNVWEQNAELRTLIFLVPGDDPRLGPVAMKMITDDRSSQAENQAPSGDSSAH